jgi:hypothetical protein
LEKNKNLWLTLLRVGITVFFIFYITKKVNLTTQYFHMFSYGAVIGAISLLFVSFYLSVVRWQKICGMLNMRLKTSTATELCFLGVFFNQFLPTSFGGDIVRFAKLRNQFGAKTVGASVIFDRLSTLVVILAHILLVFLLINMHVDSNFSIVTIFVGLSLPVAWFLKFLIQRFFAVNFKVSEVFLLIFYSYLSFLALVAAFSLLMFSLGAAVSGAGGNHIEMLHFPLSLILSALPVSLGGWGLREAYLMTAGNSLNGGALVSVSVMYGLLGIVVAVPGIYYFLKERSS